MRLETWLTKRKMLIVICLILVSLLLYISFSSYGVYQVNSKNYRISSFDSIKQRMDSLFLAINDFPLDEGDDILYLGKLKSLEDLVNLEGRKEFVSAREKLEEDLFVFLEVNTIYSQLRYIDENGDEIVRVDQGENGPFVVDDEELQNKKDRYYFEDTMLLDRDEVYVSKLDLNVENGVLENRGTEENPEYVPVIRYSIPVFDHENVNRGIVIINVYADYFLEDIRRLDREGEFAFLVENDGYYLAHSNRSKEFSFMFDGQYSFGSDYPEVMNSVQDMSEEKMLETDTQVFTFRYIYPTIGTFEIYQGSKKTFGEKSEDIYYWVLVTVSNKEVLESGIDSLKAESIIFVLISAVFIFVIFILLLIILVMNGSLKK